MRCLYLFLLHLKKVIITKSVLLIGIEDGVEINTGTAFCVCGPPKQILAVDIDIEQTIHVHFENIFFVSEGNQIQIPLDAAIPA
jgi:hypothetical protein